MSVNCSSIAIIGIACRFAGCGDLQSFWHRILDGTAAFSDSPEADAEFFHSPEAEVFNRVSTLRGGYLRDLWNVSSSSLGTLAGALGSSNPEQALAIYLVHQAIEDAGFTEKKGIPRESTSIFLGYAPYMDRATVNWIQHGMVVDQTLDLIRRCFPHGTTLEFEELRKNLEKVLPGFDARSIISLFNQMIVSRIAQRFDLQGSAHLIDVESVSVHAALQTAIDELVSGRSDLVIAGGIQGVVSPQLMMPLDSLGFLSQQPAIHPFGRDADGTLLGEGGGIFVLKRLEDARRDEDRVYAVLRSVGQATFYNDKDHEFGLGMAIGRGLQRAGISPGSLAMIEAHGSGVESQDRSEVRALDMAFEDHAAQSSIALSSVKALIGHCGFAAGAAGVIKAALSLYHNIIPPSQEASHPHPQLKLGETPFYLNLQARPWIHNHYGEPRRAGVCALAMGGISGFAVLEQYLEKT